MVPQETFVDKVRLYSDCLRPSILTPKLEVKSWHNIDTLHLRLLGIKGLIFDADNTLTEYDRNTISPYVVEDFVRLASVFPSCIVSNTKKDRALKLAEKTGMHVIAHQERKPRNAPFVAGFDYLNATFGIGAKPEEVAVIGDRLLTDIAGGNRLGMYTIKVNPINWKGEPRAYSVIRCLETAVLRFYQE